MAENELHTVEAVEEKKGVLKIGFSQIGNPTPIAAKYVFKAVLFLAVAWSFIAPTITELSPETIAIINTWSLRLVGLVRVSIAFFGLDYKEENQ